MAIHLDDKLHPYTPTLDYSVCVLHGYQVVLLQETLSVVASDILQRVVDGQLFTVRNVFTVPCDVGLHRGRATPHFVYGVFVVYIGCAGGMVFPV